MMKRVCNALNTSDYDMIDGMDCIDYWSVSKNEKARYCRVSRKEETPDDKLVGGHVITFNALVPHVYIVPMLSSYNARKEKLESFDVDENSLVRVPEEQERKILSDPANIAEIKRRKNASFFDTLRKQE